MIAGQCRRVRAASRLLAYIVNHPANREDRVRALGRAVAYQLSKRVRPGVQYVSFGEGLVLRVPPGKYGASKVIYADPPDYHEMMFWSQNLGSGDLFVDIGANCGSYAVWCAATGASVIAIEPDDDAFHELSLNASLNNLEMQLVKAAATNSVGAIHFTTGLDTTNHLAAPGQPGTVEVPTVRLDDVIGARHVRGAKLDIEGFEYTALEGAKQALAEHRIDALQLEWNEAASRNGGQSRDDIFKMLRAFGYRPFAQHGRRISGDAVPKLGGDVLFGSSTYLSCNVPAVPQ